MKRGRAGPAPHREEAVHHAQAVRREEAVRRKEAGFYGETAHFFQYAA